MKEITAVLWCFLSLNYKINVLLKKKKKRAYYCDAGNMEAVVFSACVTDWMLIKQINIDLSTYMQHSSM